MQRLDRTGKRPDRGIAQLEVPVADGRAEHGIVDAERQEGVRGDPRPRLPHPRPPLAVPVGIAPENLADPLDLPPKLLGVEPGARLRGFAARDLPALVP